MFLLLFFFTIGMLNKLKMKIKIRHVLFFFLTLFKEIERLSFRRIR